MKIVIMEDLQECIDFFGECELFIEKYRKFERACRNLWNSDANLNLDLLRETAEYYVLTKHNLSEICLSHFKQCKHESDSMSVDFSSDEDTDDNDESDETDVSSNDESDETDEDETEEEEDDGILFQAESCCLEKILLPFFEAVEDKKVALSMIRKVEDSIESQYERLDQCFAPHEKKLSSKLLQEICHRVDQEGYKYFKRCSSIYVKMLTSYCKHVEKSNVLKEMFGDDYSRLLDDKVPLSKKRKIFTDQNKVAQLVEFIKENSLPDINQYIQDKQREYLEKHT